MSYESLEALKKLTEELNLRDQTLKESLLFLTKLPIAVLAVNKSNRIVFLNEKAKEKIAPRKRKLENSELAEPEVIQHIIDLSAKVFETQNSYEGMIELYEEKYKLTISPLENNSLITYALIMLIEV